MREIKFRAWNPDNKNHPMVQNALFRCDAKELLNGEGFYKNWILMQFTGLVDKNGTEIYEGDILDFPDCSFSAGTGEYDDEISRGVVEWDSSQAMFSVTNRMTVDMEDFDWQDSEIIGNIYQHPELLKD